MPGTLQIKLILSFGFGAIRITEGVACVTIINQHLQKRYSLSKDTEPKSNNDPDADSDELLKVIPVVLPGFKKDGSRDMQEYPDNDRKDVVEE